MQNLSVMDQLEALGREQSAQMIFLHQKIATRLGMSVVELKCFDYLLRNAQVTPGKLSELTGLTPGSVTALLARLERNGLVTRRAHPMDHRKVIVEPRPEALPPEAGLMYQSISQAWQKVCERYSLADLQVVADFMEQSVEMLREETAKVPKYVK